MEDKLKQWKFGHVKEVKVRKRVREWGGNEKSVKNNQQKVKKKEEWEVEEKIEDWEIKRQPKYLR